MFSENDTVVPWANVEKHMMCRGNIIFIVCLNIVIYLTRRLYYVIILYPYYNIIQNVTKRTKFITETVKKGYKIIVIR